MRHRHQQARRWIARRVDHQAVYGARASPAPVHLVGVYRNANVDNVLALTEQVVADGGVCAWWCLDGPPPAALAHLTVGTGPGLRCELLNRAAASLPDERVPLVIADDDVVLTRGTIRDLVDICRRAAFIIGQPAHDAASFVEYPSLRRLPWVIARRSNFVEIGPIVVVGADHRRRIMPMPEELGMGWGLDYRWASNLLPVGPIGVVDAVVMRHLVPLRQSYVVDAAMKATLATEVRRWRSARSCRHWRVWPRWRAKPSWQLD